MPYHIGEKGSYDCAGYPVVKDSDNSVVTCHKTLQDAKDHLTALNIHVVSQEKSADGFSPPQGARNNAKRGLELRREFGRGGTAVGVARARDISNGKSLPLETINRMVSYFARHEVDKKGENWGNASNPSRGYIAWLLWGGDAGKTWADSIAEREKKKDKSMTTDFTHSYAAIIKQEKQEDGTLLVYGKATDDSIDIDQQICDAGWLDTAMPQWFKTGGNIREQHSNIAAGVAKELDSKPDGHYISALVVDPVSVKKVETGVLKGFSIGIRAPRIVRDQKAANGRIIDGQIVEISLVDRPANPNAKLTLAKSDNAGTLEQVEEFIEKAEPDYENINRGGKGSEPSDTELYNRVKREAKEKFDVYPSAVANAWVTNEYKKRGGGYKKEDKNTATQTVKGEKMEHEEEDKAVSEKPSNEEMLKMYEEAKSAYMDAKMALDECKSMCKEAGLEIEDEEKAEYGESAEEETEEGSKPEAAEEEVEEAEGKKPLDKAEKCLECGCDQPSNTHGRKDVSTATMVSPTETPKSLDTIIPRIDVDGNDIADDGTEEDSSDDEDLSKKTITAIIEKAVKSAKDAITTEVLSYQEEINKLNAELATAKTKAVSGGPKRAAIKVDVQQMSEFLSKAAEYRAKSAVTADKDLARGYRELASDFEAKAAVLKPSN
jgi:hypothetical protein